MSSKWDMFVAVNDDVRSTASDLICLMSQFIDFPNSETLRELSIRMLWYANLVQESRKLRKEIEDEMKKKTKEGGKR